MRSPVVSQHGNYCNAQFISARRNPCGSRQSSGLITFHKIVTALQFETWNHTPDLLSFPENIHRHWIPITYGTPISSIHVLPDASFHLNIKPNNHPQPSLWSNHPLESLHSSPRTPNIWTLPCYQSPNTPSLIAYFITIISYCSQGKVNTIHPQRHRENWRMR